MSIAPFPHHYTVSLSGDELLAPPRPPITTGAPPQFGGSEQVWGPEELLAGAVLVCLQTTFAAFAKRASLRVLDWKGSITATLERGKPPAFASIVADIAVTTEPGDEERAAELMRSAQRHCIISHALAAPVTVNVTTTSRSVSAAS